MLNLNPPETRYIKLGKSGAHFDECLRLGILRLGFPQARHDLCQAGNWKEVEEDLVDAGRVGRVATEDIREIKSFYELPTGSLWVTFARGHMWWSIAGAESVKQLEAQTDDDACKQRATLDGWHKLDLKGKPLRIEELSSPLTQVANYRRTICKIKDEAYLLRRIRGEEEPEHTTVRKAEADLTEQLGQLIRRLDWRTVEDLVDLIFARSGWRRISRLGGTMADIDLIAEDPLFEMRIWVQVKTGASQHDLEDYIDRFQQNDGCDRFLFVCSNPRTKLTLPDIKPDDMKRYHIWSGDSLATKVASTGLTGWVLNNV